MENISQLVRARRSVRTFDARPLSSENLERLQSFMADIENPCGIPVEFRLLHAKEQGLKCPVVVGTDLFVAGKVPRVSGAELAFGYSMETLVLYAQSLGIGTVWIGGTMDRAAFERAAELREDQCMPCVSPLGYPAAQLSLRESVMRKGARADSRLPFSELFFRGDFQTPLEENAAGKLRDALEAVRWAPSAVNRQPWRAVVTDTAVHFYKKTSKGFVSRATGDLQKVDVGIALCHFALTAAESGLALRFSTQAPDIPAAADTEYIASYLLG